MTIMETSGFFWQSKKKTDSLGLTDYKIINQSGFPHKNGH